MAGIGDYTKGKKFTLKSGNSPAFKMIGDTEAGDSPITNEKLDQCLVGLMSVQKGK